jgi:hypothetical protein
MLRFNSMFHAVLSTTPLALSHVKGGDYNAEAYHAGAGRGCLSIYGWGELFLLLFQSYAFQITCVAVVAGAAWPPHFSAYLMVNHAQPAS